jgi:translation initiation factor IF-3
MAVFIAFRAAATALFVRPTTSSVTYACRVPHLSARHAATRASWPGSDRPRDRGIPHSIVYLVDEEGRLGLPTPLSRLLASINPQTHFIELVDENPRPVVKIRDKQEQIRKEKEWKKRQREVASNNVQKEIQMTWAVEPADLAHKLNKARREVEKGSRVELVFAPKVNQRAPSSAIMDARMKDAAEKIAEFAREWKPRKVEYGIGIFYLKKLDTNPS